MNKAKPTIIFVLGGPGAGKGTQCSHMVEKFRWVHLSAGELLREERKKGSQKGELIESYLVEGKIVPSEITVGLLEDAMLANGWDQSKFIIDGFPRNFENMNNWNTLMEEKVDLKKVLVFDCPLEVLEERILKRASTSGRSDDNIESLRKRFTTFQEETCEVIKFFQERQAVERIDGNREVATVSH